jgi:hypothetical protein
MVLEHYETLYEAVPARIEDAAREATNTGARNQTRRSCATNHAPVGWMPHASMPMSRFGWL